MWVLGNIITGKVRKTIDFVEYGDRGTMCVFRAFHWSCFSARPYLLDQNTLQPSVMFIYVEAHGRKYSNTGHEGTQWTYKDTRLHVNTLFRTLFVLFKRKVINFETKLNSSTHFPDSHTVLGSPVLTAVKVCKLSKDIWLAHIASLNRAVTLNTNNLLLSCSKSVMENQC